jgi:hypothetical protein
MVALGHGLMKANGLVSSYGLARPSNAQKQPDRQDEGFVGPVRKVRLKALHFSKLAWLVPMKRRIPLRMISFNNVGNKIKVVNYEPTKADMNQIEVYRYDRGGRRIEKTVKQGSMVAKALFYYADSEGRIDSIEKVTDGTNLVSRRYTSIFDDQGNQIKASYQEDSTPEFSVSYRYRFDDNGRTRTIETYDAGGSLYHEIVCSYDSAGRLSKESCYGPGGHEYARKTFIYGPNGWTEEKMALDVASSLERKITYRYDARNNLVDVAGYDSHDSLIGRTSHALQYDNVGNWIERVSQTWDIHTGKPDSESINYQTIDYY